MVTDITFSCLGDPIRWQIVRRLAGSPLSVNEIAAGFDISRPAISRHLRVLREAGLVSENRAGRERIYQLQKDALRAAAGWLSELASERPAGRLPDATVARAASESSERTLRPNASAWRQW